MDISEETIQKILKFSKNRQATEKESTSEPLSTTALQAYAHRLDKTLEKLQEQFRLQEDELIELRKIHSHGLLDDEEDIWARVSRNRRIQKAYESLLATADEVPATDPILPSLIAVEETAMLVTESKAAVSQTAHKLSADRERLKMEEANLQDSQLIASGLRERIQIIRNLNARKQKQTPSQVAQEVIGQKQERNTELLQASKDLKYSLVHFIDETLAPMLAAEDLGGPTVGDALEVSDATLKAGYTAHGKPKKQKPTEPQEGGQQRIDQFLRGNVDGTTSNNKREAAAEEVHELLNALLDAGTSYVDLKRDSAISRFLVGARVAQFHPRDAKRLRLIDFSRSLR
ncbi:hypothetical protein N7495_004279 [Penicillium taxi]|uniref:uncharacterized protein n=1 Tax=Penicillium taxi TaxID=168475 RepID=UPI00254543B5|nr:uncharacterized protein N7495_004279 [Penicillium taxi]KAJ5899535.1 hypothetical protein N7495_004279 [Penicillium taxi]